MLLYKNNSKISRIKAQIVHFIWDILIASKLFVCENYYNFRCNLNPLLIGLERCLKNWEKAENLLFPATLMLLGPFFLSSEIDVGADGKQDFWFYLGVINLFTGLVLSHNILSNQLYASLPKWFKTIFDKFTVHL